VQSNGTCSSGSGCKRKNGSKEMIRQKTGVNLYLINREFIKRPVIKTINHKTIDYAISISNKIIGAIP
ncbi:MAG: hypothetical protein ACRDE8_13895, partial [Ginsengibacter sp.]